MSEVKDQPPTYALRLGTSSTHSKLDEHIMGLGLFSNQESYKKFVTLQYFIHNDAKPLYDHAKLKTIIPNLTMRNRFEKVKEDMLDLNMEIPTAPTPIQIQNVSAAIGALYVVEGSKLGAKYLLHHVEKFGLSDQFGARHLGPDEEGRGVSWRSFQKAIDTANIDIPVAVKAAEQTFDRVFTYLNQITA
ncbi:biliverdin-producing heme oxygenase [Commensalibacter oyaizuii]|uniref:Biliverdin-producing heme oxygenase n=1 Tax=Commensalibacter oyaizuii TaxID=3043873 RepID=A0ABT6Q346_9PROT|nr:biliverdin-producing heme oxygenase [Commensalibacter sp. TBRC 16381]MDI2091509.1 biliverdin-producing heme oxygenase [Commensalibacter sp. TBRC 16381]